MKRILAGLGILIAAAFAQDRADREKLLGTWQEEGDTHQTWTLENKGDTLRVARSEDSKVNLELACKPNGSDCDGVDAGKKVRVTMYYNGAALMQMETKDTYVTTRKFMLASDTDKLSIDTTPVTGPGKASSLQLVRRRETAAR